MRNLIFLFSKAQRYFRNELFNLVEAQCNCAISERDFRTKSKRNLTSAIKLRKHNGNFVFLHLKALKEQVIYLRRSTSAILRLK